VTGAVVAALALAVAVLVAPSAWRRIAPAPAGRRALIGTAGWPTGCAALAAIVAATLPSTAALAAAVLGVTAAIRHRRRRRARRGLDEARALETALDVLVGELRVGAHPVRALTVAAAEIDTTHVGAGLRTVTARARLGADVPAGLRSLAAGSALPAQWERLAVCWQLAGEHGLAMSALMRAAQRDIAERHRFSARVAAGMAGARATAAILAGLPGLGVLLGQLIGAAPVGFLLGGRAGGWVLVAGVTLTCAGLLWSDRITDRTTAGRP
jgi:tight adherence protein B